MNWFIWRQHRKQFLIFGILLVAFAALVIPSGLHFWHSYQHALTTCSQTASCKNLDEIIFKSSQAQFVKSTVFAVGLFAPILLGLFLGSPLLAREYEEGTNKLAWTQGVSRRRWLTTKLVWALAFAALYGVAITLLTTWWSRTGNALFQDRFDAGQFDIQGLMPVAYSVFFTAVGFTMGAWFRKTLLALGVTLGIFVLFQVSFAQFIRKYYVAPVTHTVPIPEPDKGIAGFGLPRDSNWLISQDIVDPQGKPLDIISVDTVPAQCRFTSPPKSDSPNRDSGVMRNDGPFISFTCLSKFGYHGATKYQPAYRYWNFQRIEAGIYLGMAAVAVAATYWLVLKRDA